VKPVHWWIATVGLAIGLAGMLATCAEAEEPECAFPDAHCPYWDWQPKPCLAIYFLGRTRRMFNTPQTAWCDAGVAGLIGSRELGAAVATGNPFNDGSSRQVAYLSVNEYNAERGLIYGSLCRDEDHAIGGEVRATMLTDGSLHFGIGLWPASAQTVPEYVGWKGQKWSGYWTDCENVELDGKPAVKCRWFGEAESGSFGQGQNVTCRFGELRCLAGDPNCVIESGAEVWIVQSEFCPGGNFVKESSCFKDVP